MKTHQALIAFGPFALPGLAALVLCGVMTYLVVFGTLLGYNVSSLDGDGPRWPFTVAYISGLIFVITTPVVIIWVLVCMFVFGRSRAGRGLQTQNTLKSR